MRTRIKICGITNPEDAYQAAFLGVDAIGLVFYPGSPRYVTIPQAQEIVEAVPAFVTTVGLFVDAQQFEVEEVLSQVPIDMLQFHGDENLAACELYNMPYIKTCHVREGIDIEEICHKYKSARSMVLDTFSPYQKGGSGRRFDWGLIPSKTAKPLILAGGLNPDNIKDAILRVRPYGVDVSSGVEKEKGIKDLHKLQKFVRGVYEADKAVSL